MKFLHSSDWHLGRMLYGYSLLEEQTWFLEQILLPAVEREKPDCILLAGDIYDRQVAATEAIRLFDRTLARLSELGCKVAVIAGNHDGADRMALLKPILRHAGIYFSTELTDAFSPVFLKRDDEKIQLYLLPYFDTSEARDYFGDDSLRGESACMERVLETMKESFLPDCKQILVAHCFAAGASSSDSESTLFVGGSGDVPPTLFSPFLYTALGHLHGPQRVGENGRYAGSPLKYSVDEELQKKSFVLIETHANGIVSQTVPILPRHDVRRIQGSFHDLLAQGENALCEDYVELNLTDTAPVLMAAEQLRPFYPRLLSVINRWYTETAAKATVGVRLEDDRRVIFQSFLNDICGWEADEEDFSLLEELTAGWET